MRVETGGRPPGRSGSLSGAQPRALPPGQGARSGCPVSWPWRLRVIASRTGAAEVAMQAHRQQIPPSSWKPSEITARGGRVCQHCLLAASSWPTPAPWIHGPLTQRGLSQTKCAPCADTTWDVWGCWQDAGLHGRGSTPAVVGWDTDRKGARIPAPQWLWPLPCSLRDPVLAPLS